jgi:hypothetical protein
MLSSGDVPRETPHPLESRYIVGIAKLFDMVNTMACRIWQVSPIAAGHRSKTQQDCLGIQGLVGWLHPRRARLGLIEAR